MPVVHSRKRAHVQDADIEMEPCVKRACDLHSIDGVAQDVASIILSSDAISIIMSYISCIDSICKLLFAAGRFRPLVLQSVTHLNLVNSDYCDCFLLANGFIQQCTNLIHLSFLCSHPQPCLTDSIVKHSNCQNLTLPESLQTICLSASSKAFAKALLGRRQREALVHLDMTIPYGANSNFLLHSGEGLMYKNLTTFKLDRLYIPKCDCRASSLQYALNKLFCKMPQLKVLSLNISRTLICLSRSIDLSRFDQLESLTLDCDKPVQSLSYSCKLTLPNGLRELKIVLPVFGDAVVCNPVDTLETIHSLVKEAIFGASFGMATWAPNLKTLTSVGQIHFLGYAKINVPTMFPKLQSIGSSVIAKNPSTWPFITQAIQLGRHIDIATNAQYIDVHDDDAAHAPPFHHMNVDSHHILDLPDITLASASSLCISQEFELLSYGILVSLATNLKSLTICNTLLDFDLDFQTFQSLEYLYIFTSDEHYVTPVGLIRIKKMVENCLPVSLKKLELGDISSFYGPSCGELSHMTTVEWRESSISLTAVFKKLPNLVHFESGFPVVDIDESKMSSINLDRFLYLRVVTFRNGLLSLEEEHVQNLFDTFGRLPLSLQVAVCQPAIQHYYPNSQKSFWGHDQPPLCLENMLSETKSKGAWYCTTQQYGPEIAREPTQPFALIIDAGPYTVINIGKNPGTPF